MAKGDMSRLTSSKDPKFMGHSNNNLSKFTKVDTNNSLDLNVKVEPSKIELLKRKLFFDLKRDETMSMSEYLNSSLSDRDVKKAS